MKLTLGLLLRMLVILLVFLTLFLVHWLGLEWRTEETGGLGPSVTTDVELMITVILCVSIGLWVHTRKEVKGWEKTLFVAGMTLGFLMFLFLSFAFGLDAAIESPGWSQAHPDTIYNLYVSSDLMFIMAAVLFVAILGFILIPRRKSIVDWIKNV